MALFTGNFRSTVLNMDTALSVVLPYDRPAPQLKQPCKVLYLLHGLGNNASSWTNNTGIERLAREQGFAVIMPDMQKSFYTNMAHGESYFTYLTEELPALCNTLFQISNKREDTFIAGLSMGGYGALKAALTYPERYIACASFSGNLDIYYTLQTVEDPNDIRKLKGIYGSDLTIPQEDDLRFLAKGLCETPPQSGLPGIYITCGLEDHLLPLSRDYTDYLSHIELPYHYEEWQGSHEWDFWDASIRKALVFFGQFSE